MSTYFFHSKRNRSHSRFFYLILCTVLVCPMLLFTGCQNTTGTSTATEKEPISISSIKLNTAIQITIYDSQDKSLLDDCLALCDRYELIFSRTNENSELYKLNHRISDSVVSNQTIETQTTTRSMAPQTHGIYPNTLLLCFPKDSISPGNPTVPLTSPLRL